MKKNKVAFITALLIFNVFTFTSLAADEVQMKNGDRISGQIIDMKDSKLVIKTGYAGNVSVKWSEVADLKTDQPISVLLTDDTVLKGSPQGFDQGKMRLSTEKVTETVSFAPADVKSINPPKVPPVKFNVRANVGLTYTSGNTDKNTEHFDGEFIARTVKNRYTAGGEINRTEDTGIKTESNSLGYLKYDHFLSEKWFAYSNALFEKDRFKDLSLRSVIGIGSGYQFYENKITNLSLEGGINYVNENYIEAADDSYSSGRWALTYDRYFYDKAFQFFHFHEGFISLEDSDDLFIKSRTGFRVPLFDHFNATLQYNLDWEKTPSVGREKSDKTLMFTLGYSFDN